MLNKIINMIQSQIYREKGSLDYHTWIFSSVDNCNFNYNSKYLFLYVREHLPQIQPLFVLNDAQKRRMLEKKYGSRYFLDGTTKDGLKKILKAGVWFTSAGLPAYEWSGNPRRIVVNLWHGIPLKKIALLEEHASTFQKLYFKRIFSNKYSYVLTTSTHLVPVMAESLGVEKEMVKVWGQPRNDVVMRGKKKEALETLLDIEEKNAKWILYAPTYRDHTATRLFPFEDYEKEELEKFLQEKKIHICIRMHLEETLEKEKYLSKNIHFLNEDVIDDIAQWMGCFDLLITDYSSIYLDYLLLDKPIIFLPYDKEEYLKDRGMNYPYDEVTPGAKPNTQQQLILNIENSLFGEDAYRAQRRECNAYFNQVTDPCCAFICQQILQEI
ncbi:MAG: CDP-glycerol glycerophosphotransferase family protein [Lachnospiraceae bacterium]